MTKRFTTELSTIDAHGGFGASGNIDPCTWADEVYGESAAGPWLACYMLRRFGWPNAGSDDYKQLCSWNLTTPMEGLFLCVTPYLGGSNLHFAIRFTKDAERRIVPGEKYARYQSRLNAAVIRWWETRGRKVYQLAVEVPDDTKRTLLKSWNTELPDGQVAGIWKMSDNRINQRWNNLPKRAINLTLFAWWLGAFIREHHPNVRLPQMTAREKSRSLSRSDIAVRSAVKATLRDLLRPTNVRDVSFTPFGLLTRDQTTVAGFKLPPAVGYFKGAGNTPEYWFGMSKAEREAVK